jgi:hypothetical protein
MLGLAVVDGSDVVEGVCVAKKAGVFVSLDAGVWWNAGYV